MEQQLFLKPFDHTGREMWLRFTSRSTDSFHCTKTAMGKLFLNYCWWIPLK